MIFPRYAHVLHGDEFQDHITSIRIEGIHQVNGSQTHQIEKHIFLIYGYLR